MSLAGCAVGDSIGSIDVPPEATTRSELDGTFSIDASCTVAERSRIGHALALLSTFLADDSDSGARAYLTDNVMTNSRRSPEYQLSVLLNKLPIVASCSASSCGTYVNSCGSISGGAEHITVTQSFVDDPTTTVAAIAGQLGYTLAQIHGFGYGSSGMGPGSVIQTALAYTMISNTPRFDFDGETELSLVGVPNGKSFIMSCAAHEMARGVRVDFGSGTAATGLTLRCDATSSSLVGLAGSSQKELHCAAGEVLVGVSANDGRSFDHLVAHCRPESDVLAGITGTATHDFTFGSGSNARVRMCPAYMAVSRIHGYVDGSPNALQIACQDLTSASRGNFTPAVRIAPGTTPLPFTAAARCLGFGTVSTMDGEWIHPSALANLRITCRGTTLPVGSTVPVLDPDRNLLDDFEIGEAHWGMIGVNCTAPQNAMVGVIAIVGSGQIAGLQPVCAARSNWYDVGMPATTFNADALVVTTGVGLYSHVPSMCARGAEIAGVQIEADANNVLGAITPLCRALSPIP